MTVADYAFSPHPSASSLKGAGIHYAGRYVSSNPANDANGKNLTPSEKDALHAAGIGFVLFAEEGATRILGGHSAGSADASHFKAVVKALGMPDAVMVCCADFDAAPGQQGAINDYLDGAAGILGRDQIALYGGYYPVSRALNAGKVSLAVQTYAWSGFGAGAVAADFDDGELVNLAGNPYTLMTQQDQDPTVLASTLSAAGLPAHAVLVTSVAGNALPGTFLFDDRAGLRQGPIRNVGGSQVDLDQTVLSDFCQWPRPSAPVTPTFTWQWWTTDGNESLAAVSRRLTAKGVPDMSPAHILRATCTKNDGHWDAQTYAWLNTVLGDPVADPHQPIPAGAKLWVLND